MQRLAAPAALGAAAVVLAGAPVELALSPPAAAQSGSGLGSLLGGKPAPSVTLSSPSTSGAQAFNTSSPRIAGDAVPGNQGGRGVISSVKVTVSSSAGHPGATFDITPQAPTSGSNWSFAGTPPTPLAYNGTYQVTVTATETDTTLLNQTSTGTAGANGSFAESVPPVAPSGVSAAPAASSAQGVSVSWNPNPEPDILGYVVLRSQGSGNPGEIGTATNTKYVDTTAKPGVSYTYSVVALRAGDTPGQSVLSPSSSAGPVTIGGAPAGPAAKTGTAKTGSVKTGSAKTGSAKTGSAKTGSPTPGGGAGQTTIPTAPSRPGITQAALAAQYQADIAAAGIPKAAPTSHPTASKSDPSATGAPSQGGFSETLPYASGGKVAAGPVREPGPGSTASSGSRARMLGTVALGMIFLVVAALAIRLVLRTRRSQ
ncbi:MAG: hypothetical protein ACRDY2_03520 [Acidimicrobiales bacterium]